MKPTLLIALNFLRQHRWPVVILFAWIVLMALAVADFGRNRVVVEDVVFYVQQQAIYICVFSAFLAADAIHNERKSRRILLVLSKAISRAEYLLAVIAGTCTVAVLYALVFGICGVWLTARAEVSSTGLWQAMVLVIAGALVSATAAMFLSTFLTPYVATAGTLLVFSAPAFMHAEHHRWFLWLPGLPILLQVLRFSFRPEWIVSWSAAGIAILQAMLFWLLAAVVFERRDIAVPVE